MAANLQGLEITDSASSVYSFEPYKQDGEARGISIETRDWELGDPIAYWKVPLYPFDGGLRQDRLPRSASLTNEFHKARSYSKANMDASNDGVLVPPPALNTTALTNTTTSTKQKSFDSKQFHLCGRYIYTIARDGTLALDKDFGSGKAAVDFEVFNNELIVAMGESEKIWKRAVGGTWTQATNNTFAIALGVVGSKLWRAHDVNQISSCTTTPLTLASWTPADPNEYTAGDTSYSIHTIIEYGGVPWILRPDGAFAPDSKSDFYNQAPQMARWPHDDNGKGAFTAQGFLWVPSIEWGDAIYLLVTDEINIGETFICKMVRDRYAITDNQVYVYHEWTRLGSSDKGYSLGINTWPSAGPISVTRDAGTVAFTAGANVDWTNASNAAASDGAYATAGQGTTDPLRWSNFGFTLPTDATILGYIVNIERKTSASNATSTKTNTDTVSNDTGIGSATWAIDIDGTDFSFARITSTPAATSNYLKFLDWGFAIPSNATITGVTVTINKLLSQNVIEDYIVRLVVNNSLTGNNKAASGRWPIFVATDSIYGSTTDLWGATLTPALVNAATFGFVIAVTLTAESDGFIFGDNATKIAVTYVVDGTEDSQVQIVNHSAAAVGDNNAVAVDWPDVDTVQTYGADDDLWGTSLTPSNVNDSDFGFQLVVVNPTGITASVDYGSMTVVYEEADIVTNPVMFIGHGTSIKYIQLGFGSGRDIDDPSYPFGTSFEIETGLIQPTQDVTLVSGIIGCSLVGKIRSNDSVTLSYALGAASSYTSMLTTAEGSGTAAITGSGIYAQSTRYSQPNITGPYFKFKLSGTAGSGAGTDRIEIRNWWAYGYSRPKVTDIIKIPIYCDRMALNGNGIPQGDTGGDTLRYFRKWKRDQEVLTFRFPDYELGRTIRVRVVAVGGEEIITEKLTDGHSRETFIAVVSFMRDDFANAYADSV
jgi:hypothetical protein